jgi:hypothetical protein
MSGRKLTADERRQRDERIVASSHAGGSAVAIAKREHLTDRQVRRILREAEPVGAALASVPELPVPELLELDPFAEVGRCVAAHREAIDQLRVIASGSRSDAIRLGAAKASASLSADLVGLLSTAGVIPRSAFEWRTELQWETAWTLLLGAVAEAGVDVDSFTECLERRLARASTTDVQLVGLGPDPQLEAVA